MTSTSGKGMWSEVSKKVKVTGIDVVNSGSEYGEGDYGELQAYFDRSWDIEEDGLIYTDDKWLKDFRSGLMAQGFSSFAVRDVDYSEQGMQGDDYVSMDAGKKFFKEYYELGFGTR